MLLLGHVAVPSLRRVINVVTAALAQAGAMTLTPYTAHILFMNSPLDVFDPVERYVFQVVVVLLFGLGWRQTVGRGPLETAVTAFANRARAVVQTAISSSVVVRQPVGGVRRGKHRPANVNPLITARPPGTSGAAS